MLPWLLKGRLLYFFPHKKRQGALIGAGALNGANTVINIVERDVQPAFAYNPHLDFGEKFLGKVFRMY